MEKLLSDIMSIVSEYDQNSTFNTLEDHVKDINDTSCTSNALFAEYIDGIESDAQQHSEFVLDEFDNLSSLNRHNDKTVCKFTNIQGKVIIFHVGYR